MALAHFCPFICPLSLIYSQGEMTFPAREEVKCVRQGQMKKKKNSSVNHRKQFLRYKVSAEMSLYCCIPVTLFKRHNIPHIFCY